MRWGNELWDKFEDVSKFVNKGIEFCNKYEAFLKKRCEIENSYARDLKKLVEQHEIDFDKTDSPSYMKCYNIMLSELRDVAGQHELVAENIEGHVILNLNQMIRSFKDERKRCSFEKEKYYQEFLQSEKELMKTRENYEKAHRSLEKAKELHYKYDNDEASTKAMVKNALCQAEKKSIYLSQVAGEYASQLAKTNEMKSLYYQSQLPQVFDVLQSLEIKRIETLSGFIVDSTKLEMDVAPRIEKCHHQILESASNINPEKDTERVIYLYKTGIQIPEDYQYIELQTKENSNATSRNAARSSIMNSKTLNNNNTLSVQLLANLSSTGLTNSKRKDKFKTLTRFKKVLNISGKNETNEWDSLPPEQLKNKLKEKISFLRSQIDKLEKSKGGAIKMHKTYMNNGALGDYRQTETEIKNMEQNILSLNTQLEACIEAYDKIDSNLSNYHTLLNNGEQIDNNNNNNNNHIYQSPSQHSVNSSPNNSSQPITPLLQHSKQTQNCFNIEHYAVSSLNKCGDNSQQSPNIYNVTQESFDEDDDLDSYCYEDPNKATVDAQIQKHQQNYKDQISNSQSNLQNHNGLISKASIESDCNSISKTKDIMYADSQYDQVDALQYTGSNQQTSSAEDFLPIGTALVLFDYKKGDIASAMNIDVNESLNILERDSGDGWTLAQRLNGERGYVPTKYVEIAYY